MDCRCGVSVHCSDTDLGADEKTGCRNRIADIRAPCSIDHFGLVLCFPYRSAKIEPLPKVDFTLGSGGGWIALGLVVKDRF